MCGDVNRFLLFFVGRFVVIQVLVLLLRRNIGLLLSVWIFVMVKCVSRLLLQVSMQCLVVFSCFSVCFNWLCNIQVVLGMWCFVQLVLVVKLSIWVFGLFSQLVRVVGLMVLVWGCFGSGVFQVFFLLKLVLESLFSIVICQFIWVSQEVFMLVCMLLLFISIRCVLCMLVIWLVF